MKGNNSTNSTIENNNNNNNNNNNKLEVDKGKSTVSKLTTSAKTLFNEVISTTTTPNLENFVNNSSNGFIKPSSSSIINSNGGSSIFKHQGWKEHISNQNQSNSNNNNNDLYLEDSISEFRSSGEEEKYQTWINDNNYNYGDEYNDYDYVNTSRSIQEKEDDDGREIIEFLNSNNYTSEIYNNTVEEEERKRREIANIDANASSHSYNYKDVEGFLESEDILEYLKQTRYTDDVYGIPKFIKKLIKEARDEMLNDNYNDNDQNNPHQKTALERLKMIRDHFINE